MQSYAGYRTWNHGDRTMGASLSGYGMVHSNSNMARTLLEIDSTVRLFGGSAQGTRVAISNATWGGQPGYATVSVQMGGYTVLSAYNQGSNHLKGERRQHVLSRYALTWVGSVPVILYGGIWAGVKANIQHGISNFGIRGDKSVGIHDFSGQDGEDGIREFAYGSAYAFAYWGGARAGLACRMDLLDATFYPWMHAGAAPEGRFVNGTLTCARKESKGQATLYVGTRAGWTSVQLANWTTGPLVDTLLNTHAK
jgi:hypothetical protein